MEVIIWPMISGVSIFVNAADMVTTIILEVIENAATLQRKGVPSPFECTSKLEPGPG